MNGDLKGKIAKALCLAQFGDVTIHGEARCCQAGGKDGCCVDSLFAQASAALSAIEAAGYVVVPSLSEDSTRQYYYRDNGCNAVGPHSPGCICWHDEGTGPLADGSARSWRTVASCAPLTGGATALNEKMEAAQVREMTPAEVGAQRRSFLRGITLGCEHGVLDFEECPQCRGRKSGLSDDY